MPITYITHTHCHCWQCGFVRLVCFFSTFCIGKILLMMVVVLYQNVTYVVYLWACIQLLLSLERFVVNGGLNWIRAECYSFKCFSFEFNDTVKFCIVISDFYQHDRKFFCIECALLHEVNTVYMVTWKWKIYTLTHSNTGISYLHLKFGYFYLHISLMWCLVRPLFYHVYHDILQKV